MSSKNNNFKFNTDSLLNELNKVIQNGMNNLLNDYIANYKLYEETHNCIMNLPSVKREINKKNELDENYDDMPDLISMSSDDSSDDYYSKYTKIQVEDETDEESDDSMLCMRKVANQLLQKKEEIIENRNKEIDDLKDRINILLEDNNKKYALFYKQKELYENVIEKHNKEIEDLKNQLNNCVKQPLVHNLTDDNDNDNDEPRQEVVVEIKQEKENIILHIEENSDQDDETDEADESGSESEDEPIEEEDEIDEEGDEAVEDESVEAEDELDEEGNEVQDDDELDEEGDEAEDDDELDEENVEDAEVSDDEDTVETEKSDSDEESQEELHENTEVVQDDEEELIEIEIDNITYCTNDEDNGFIYELDNYGNVGEVIGYLKDGEPFFN